MNKEKLKQLFEKCVDKQRVAKECGMSYQSVYNLLYKENTTCKVESLERIAKYFGKRIGYFFDEDDESQSAVVSGNGSVAVAGNNNFTSNAGDTAVLQERVKMLEKLLDEKERLIKVLMEK